MVFLRLAFANLLRHRTRSLLTLTGIATSVAVLFSIMSFNKGFSRGLARELDRTGIHFMVVPSGCPHEVASLVLHGAVIPKFLDISILDRIKEVEGLDFATPLYVTQVPNPARGRVDLVYGVETSRLSALKPAWKVDGSFPAERNEIMVGAEVASHDGLNAGDLLTYGGTEFRISGIVRKTGGQDDAFVYMDIGAVQALMKKDKGATAIGVRLTDPSLVQKATDELAQRVPGIQIVTMGQVMNSIANLAASAKVLSLSVAFVAVLVSAVGVMNTMLMSVFERTPEIGMLRAIGASRQDIFRIIIKEGLLLSLAGGLSGIAAATAGSGLIDSVVRRMVPYVPGGDMVVFDPWIAAASLIFVFIFGALSAVYPSVKASRISPIEAIRG